MQMLQESDACRVKLTPVLGVAHRYEMQEAGVALDSDMKNLCMVQYSA